jgi:hypothetical protein
MIYDENITESDNPFDRRGDVFLTNAPKSTVSMKTAVALAKCYAGGDLSEVRWITAWFRYQQNEGCLAFQLCSTTGIDHQAGVDAKAMEAIKTLLQEEGYYVGVAARDTQESLEASITQCVQEAEEQKQGRD